MINGRKTPNKRLGEKKPANGSGGIGCNHGYRIAADLICRIFRVKEFLGTSNRFAEKFNLRAKTIKIISGIARTRENLSNLLIQGV